MTMHFFKRIQGESKPAAEIHVQDRLQQIICGITGRTLDELIPEADLIDDLQLGSMQMIDLMLSMEHHFNVKFSNTELNMANFKTLGTLLMLLNYKLGMVDGRS
jgi:acyl carrier protein